MKTSNLLLLLGAGGIGYYLLKNKKSQQIAYSDTTLVSPTPEGVIVGNTSPIVNKNVETAFAPSIPSIPTLVNTSSPKIEQALAPLKVVEVTSTGQPLFQPPANTTWVNPPSSLDAKGNTNTTFGYTTQSSVDRNPDMALLIRNPSIKSKNNYYIDQYGNLIQAPSKAFPNGVLIETAQRIAVWRKANGITV
jgi:hypothetical protein